MSVSLTSHNEVYKVAEFRLSADLAFVAAFISDSHRSENKKNVGLSYVHLRFGFSLLPLGVKVRIVQMLDNLVIYILYIVKSRCNNPQKISSDLLDLQCPRLPLFLVYRRNPRV